MMSKVETGSHMSMSLVQCKRVSAMVLEPISTGQPPHPPSPHPFPFHHDTGLTRHSNIPPLPLSPHPPLSPSTCPPPTCQWAVLCEGIKLSTGVVRLYYHHVLHKCLVDCAAVRLCTCCCCCNAAHLHLRSSQVIGKVTKYRRKDRSNNIRCVCCTILIQSSAL